MKLLIFLTCFQGWGVCVSNLLSWDTGTVQHPSSAVIQEFIQDRKCKGPFKNLFAMNLFVSYVCVCCVCVGFLISSALQRDGVLSPHLPLRLLPILSPLFLCSIFNGMVWVWWEGTWGCWPCPLMWSVSPISPSVHGPFKTDLEWGIKESHWCFPWSGDWGPKWYPTPCGPVPLWNQHLCVCLCVCMLVGHQKHSAVPRVESNMYSPVKTRLL